MATISFATQQAADARSAELWVAILGRDKIAEDVTTYAYPRRVRLGGGGLIDPDAGLPDGVDVAIEIGNRDAHLDTLLRADEMTADEVAALVGLYPAWSGAGVVYVAGDIRAHGGTLYRCVQGHPSQVGWEPSTTPALWMTAHRPGEIPAWTQPVGAHDAWPLGALVTYQGQVWRSTIAANVWPPGTESLWVVVE